ncbi:MAG TPA: pantetheine-phosphate adenylyltransferase [Petrotogaceae bacterium]|nr:pantetheine-phosphate adenylyltransferase [Petrotogaceae bacterium]
MSERIAIYPGSFDPVTLGHINIVERTSKIFDHIHVVVMHNPSKKYLFSVEERVKLTGLSLEHLSNVSVDYHCGLMVDYARKKVVKCVIRGLRAVTDFEFELQMANANRSMCPGLEIFFLMSDVTYSFISSSMVKEVAKFGGDVSTWVSPLIEKELKLKFAQT